MVLAKEPPPTFLLHSTVTTADVQFSLAKKQNKTELPLLPHHLKYFMIYELDTKILGAAVDMSVLSRLGSPLPLTQSTSLTPKHLPKRHYAVYIKNS